MGCDPLKCPPAVVVGGGHRVLGGEAVLNGHRQDPGLRNEAGLELVLGEGEGGLEGEASPVNVDENREPLIGSFRVDLG